MDQSTIEAALFRIALEKSEAFCYGCYVKVIKHDDGSTKCPRCQSDDFMRIISDDGPEFGVSWIIDRLLADNCEEVTTADLSERFQQMLDDCYPEIQICGTVWNQGEALKRLDPVAFDLAVSEYVDHELGVTLVTVDNGSTYFDMQSVEDFISQH